MAASFIPITPVEVTPGTANSWIDTALPLPAGATGALYHVYAELYTAPAIGIRKHGSTDDRYQAINSGGQFWCAMGVDGNRHADIYVGHLTDISVLLVGYTIAGVTFLDNGVEKIPAGVDDWYDLDCFAQAPGAAALIFEIVADATNRTVGLKKNGSTDNRTSTTTLHTAFGFIVGCDGSQICRGYTDSTDVKLYLVGYITDGATFNTNAANYSLDTTGAWTDLPSALPAGSRMGFFETISLSGTPAVGFRKKGSLEDIYKNCKLRTFAIVNSDAFRLIEGKISSVNADFYLIGYTEAVADPPDVTTNVVTNDDDEKADFHANLTDLGGAGSVDVSILYGLVSGALDHETTAQTVVGIGIVDFPSIEIWASQTIYYQAKAVGDGTAYGAELSFASDAPSFTGQRLYWDDTRLTALRALKATDSRYIAIKAAADAAIADPAPTEPASLLTGDAASGQPIINVVDATQFVPGVDYWVQDDANSEWVRVLSKVGNAITLVSNLANAYTTVAHARYASSWRAYMNVADAIRIFIERNVICAYIEEDTDYADVAIGWMEEISGWSEWNYITHGSAVRYQMQVPSWFGMAYGTGYDALKKFMTPADRATIYAGIVEFIGYMKDGYTTAPFVEEFFNTRAVLSAGVGIPSCALKTDTPAGWAAQTEAWLVEAWDLLPGDGSVDEGMGYAEYGVDGLIHYTEALRNTGGIDYFAAYPGCIDELGEWFAFMTYNGRYLQYNCASWSTAMYSDSEVCMSVLYLIAKEFSDAYTQQYADTYVSNDIMQSFVFRDSTLTPLALSGLGTYKEFDVCGVSVYREDWTATGLLIFTHAGRSTGHRHAASGEFQIYQGGKPVTCDASGYTVGSVYGWGSWGNFITVGVPYVGTLWGKTIPGKGQGKGGGDLGNTIYNELYGKVEESFANAYYFYTRINGTPGGAPGNPYDGYDNPTGDDLDTGLLTNWIRHTVYNPSVGALIVFDRVANGVVDRKNWMFHATNACGGETITLTIAGNEVRVQKVGGTTPAGVGNTDSIVLIVEPLATDATLTQATEDPSGNKAWKYLMVYPTVDVVSTQFLNAIFPVKTDYDAMTIERVSQDNCSGVIITSNLNNNKSVILFSNDGTAVDEWIDLGGRYKAADGEAYSFVGDTVRAQFTDYVVMELTRNSARGWQSK